MLQASDILSISYPWLIYAIQDYLECAAPWKYREQKEKSLQHRLVAHLMSLGFNAEEEYKISEGDWGIHTGRKSNWRIDIAVHIRGRIYFFELKYNHKGVSTYGGARQRNDYWRDVYKLEKLCQKMPQVHAGWVIMLTDNPFFWENKSKDSMMHLSYSPKTLWFDGDRIRFNKHSSYRVRWYDTNSSYRYCITKVRK